ncbi:hypothetical protein HDV05_007173 [Chytridiales sp. JEL 0842]|nr:hypothetical protein HDV05_007173 [Chytridiales sp. JEL 0842]
MQLINLLTVFTALTTLAVQALPSVKQPVKHLPGVLYMDGIETTDEAESFKNVQRNKAGVNVEKRAPVTKLTYWGGDVIENVEVITVFYGAAAYQTELNTFYKAVANSEHFDWLGEYNTPRQSIGRGRFLKSYVEPNPLPPTQILDNDDHIQPYLKSLVSSGVIGTPNKNTYIALHFGPGYTITNQGQQSCKIFCAYHNTLDVSEFQPLSGDKYIFYGVMPDITSPGSKCGNGCGIARNKFDNLASVSTHELIEAVTDPLVGIATEIGAPLGWYSETQGEIGDICNGQQGKVTGPDGNLLTVQLEWSNAKGACIAKKAKVAATPVVGV